MKSRKSRSTSKKKPGISDVSPSTSLPPLVEGQLRCFLRITVSKLLWTIPKPPTSLLVRLRWWGETSDGTLFRPRIRSQIEQKTVKTTSRFAIRCGPKQFTSYLTDMGMLVLEVMTKADHLPIGRVQINGLAQLSPTHPISGFFTIVSPTSEKIGELQVSLGLEPLSETYDSCNSLPTTDVSSEMALSAHGSPFIIPLQSQKLPGSNASGKESVGSSRATTPRGRDHLYFQENPETTKDSFFEAHRHPSSNPTDSHNQVNLDAQDEALKNSHEPQFLKYLENREVTKPPTDQATDVHKLSLSNPAARDLLSVLLDQGNRLRNAMVVSSLKSDPEKALELDGVHPLMNKKHNKVTRLSEPSSRKRLQSLEKISNDLPTKDPLILPTEHPVQNFDPHAEKRAIQLLLGSVESSPMRYWDGIGSPPESLSAESDIYDHSELNDPHYDQSLLEHLFYSAPKSDSSLSFLSEDDGTKSKMKKEKTRPTKDGRHQSQGMTSSSHELKEHESEKKQRRLIDTEDPPDHKEEPEVISLTVDRLALLGRIRVARVIVESLKIPPESNRATPSKKSQHAKPPRPTAAVKRTFFVEFHFPVASSKSASGQVSMATEVTRIASSKVVAGVVAFRQRFVFPVHFSGMMIEHWWSASLTFKIFSRKSTQKKPVLIGSAALSLRDVLQSEMLSSKWDLPMYPVQEENEKTQFGPLKVSVELSGDSKDFTSVDNKPSVAAQRPPVYAVTSPAIELLEPVSNMECSVQESPNLKRIARESPRENHEPRQVIIEIPQASVHQQRPLQPRPLPTSRNLMRQFDGPNHEEDEEGILLHAILMVPDGKDFITGEYGNNSPCNVYLNCKLFTTLEASRSSVVWGTTEPAFNFSQVAPVSLTRRLLQRLKNNMMIIEAWNKMPSPGQDRLLGLVKLPLHQFYMSFSDPKISRLLLEAQYPVVAVDSYMPVIDLYTGSRNGSLRVLLAMGSGDQIVALQRLKNDEVAVPEFLQRPAHFLDQPLPSRPVVGGKADGLVEHVFEIHVEKVKGLTPLQSTVWGEADCYVQYYFPTQESDSVVRKGAEQLEAAISLKPVRTSTTLCMPDPVFNDQQNHTLLLSADVPVQRLLLSAFSSPGHSGGGIAFEIWCRYYYPNVRDQMVAKATLPLSRLCAMVTMQHREEVGIQTFNLPLTPRTESTDEAQPPSSGLLDVSVKYRRLLKTATGVLAARSISLTVQVHRASGLQAAARVVAQQHSSFQYWADVGVNAYVTLHLSFLPDDQKRSTRAVAKTFHPEFDHHTEFPCNLVIQRSSGESCSLAELLEHSEAVFSIYHQNIGQAGEVRVRSSQDFLLGVVKVATKDLLTKRSGISGWHPVTLPEELVQYHSASVLQTVVGGLELSVAFAHRTERDRVMEAARVLGWDLEEESQDDSADDAEEWQRKENLVNMTVSIPRVWLPVHCMLFAGQKHVRKSTFCYFRYKLYSTEPVCSSLMRPKVSEDGKQVTVMFEQTKSVELTKHQSLVWYLREERMEIQVWRAYGKDTTVERPQDTDRLIGCAYVDLSPLSARSSNKLSVSGVYPLFKRNASDLSGAGVRVHIALASAYHPAIPAHQDSYTEDAQDSELDDTDDDEHHASDKRTSQKPSSHSETVPSRRVSEEEAPVVDLENTFAVNVTVERAMHLSLKGSPLTERDIAIPSCCVSFAVAGSDVPICTPVVENTDSPVWNFQQQTRLPKELLLDRRQTLVFKVWHKGDVERVIGFASVDLSPLLSGFQSVCGWYNIGDFSGQCQGQIKVSVTPLESIYHLKEEKRVRNEFKAMDAKAPVQSSYTYQSGTIFSSFPSYTASEPEQSTSNVAPNETAFTAYGGIGTSGLWSARHDEHMQNVRRFHESMHHAERSTLDTGNLDSLSQSSRTSVLTALRKNLGELDDIQRYFNQKLTRPFPGTDLGSPPRGSREVVPEPYEPTVSTVDTDARQLLDKSQVLVSQVSNLITDLQVMSKENTPSFSVQDGKSSNSTLKPPVNLHENNRSIVSLRPLLNANDGASNTVHKPPINAQTASSQDRAVIERANVAIDMHDPRRGMLDEFLEQVNSENQGTFPAQLNHDMDAADILESCSEEDYDEDLIEPRTLNELTAFTDKTSPWSSMLSEVGPGDEALSLNKSREYHQKAETENVPTENRIGRRLSISQSQEDPKSLPVSSRSDDSELFGLNNTRNDLEGSNVDADSERSSQRHLDDGDGDALIDANPSYNAPFGATGAEKHAENNVELESSAIEDLHSSVERDNEDILVESVLRRVKSRMSFASGPDKQNDSESDDADSDRPAMDRFSADDESSSGQDHGRRLEDSDEHTERPSVVLSDPVLFPNFFLPPKHLEASMRMLSISPALPSTHKTGTGSRGIPFRRHERHKRDLTSTELPQEETERIAKIFASRFSKKD